MRTFPFFLLLCIFVLNQSFAQVRTEETRTATDSASGQTTVTRSVVVAKSEDISPHNGMLVVNPLKFFLFYNLSFFYKVTDGTALGIGFQMPTIGGIDGFGINLEGRGYPSSKSLRGFYIAPNFSYNRLSTSGGTDITTAYSFGVLMGWQWFPGDDFAMGLGIGVDRYWSGDHRDDVFGKYEGSVPVVRFDIGYGW